MAKREDSCIFCAIVAGVAEAEIVHSDELAVAFLDQRPLFHGHVLLVPREHHETLADLPPKRDRLLFIGLNPSPVSVAAGHYHQGRLGQTFWRRLMTVRIIPAGPIV